MAVMGEFVRSGSGDAEDGGNIRYVHHQGQFFQRVIYQHRQYQRLLREKSIQQSMSRKG